MRFSVNGALPFNALLFYYFCIHCSCTAHTATLGHTFGVAPSALQYFAGESFRCDGKSIPITSVNDDYCDCPLDGSDEPGTSACSRGQFYCANKEFIGRSISSSRVHDGVCDCCDGSDELNHTICKNTCLEEAEAYRRKQNEVQRIRSEGLNMKREYMDYGKNLRSTRLAELKQVEQSLSQKETEIQTLKYKKETAENEEAKAKELEKERTASAAKEELNRIKPVLEQLKTTLSLDLKKHMDTLQHAISSLTTNDEADPGVSEAGDDPDPVDLETAASEMLLWHASLNLSDFLSLKIFQEEFLLEDDPSEKAPETFKERALNYYRTCVSPLFSSVKNILIPQDVIENYDLAHSKANEARRLLIDAEASLRDLEGRRAELKKKLELFYGSDEEFSKLDGQCIEYKTDEYIYEMCPYGSATQKSKEGTRIAGLGSWMNMDRNSVNTWKFEKGDQCWNGPQRSLIVQVSCGTENIILSVTEPQKCEYSMTMTSPSLCDSSHEQPQAPIHQEL